MTRPKPVFRVPYRIVGAGLPVLDDFLARQKAARAQHWGLVVKYGALGYRPGTDGRIVVMYFDAAAGTVPQGFRIARRVGAHYEAAPIVRGASSDRIARAAVTIRTAFNTSLQLPDVGELAAALGYAVTPSNAPMDGEKVYYPAFYDCTASGGPAFMHLPEQIGGYRPEPGMLVECSEREMWRAVDEHNAHVDALEKSEGTA